MRRAKIRIAPTIVVGAALGGIIWVSAGDLNPPSGPVTPTMKTLSDVEPRIAVNATNTPPDSGSVYRISAGGSYYLTGDVLGMAGKHGIEIAANGVTLDLNGYSLVGVIGSLNGIHMPGFRQNVVIRNGHVRGWGQSGIESRIDLGRIENVIVANNGEWGIDNASGGTFSTTINACHAFNNGILVAGTGGIRGAQNSLIRNCAAFFNTGTGISVAPNSTVRGCQTIYNTADGIVALSSSLVTNCVSLANDGDGIEAASASLIVGNLCDSNGNSGDGANIHVKGSDTRVEGNTCLGADRGIDVDAAGNFIVRNSCSGNLTNWDIVAGNAVGSIVQASTNAAAIVGNAYAGSLGSDDPNANFTY